MKINYLKILAVLFVLLVIVNVVLFVIRIISEILFWVIMIVAAVFAYKGLPKMKK